MNAFTLKRRLCAFGLLLCSLAIQAAPPDAAKVPATGTATEVMALSDGDVAALRANFSADRRVSTQRDGEKLYQAICQGCHMPQGQGAKSVGFYPALANNPKLASAAYPVNVVVNGLHGMPGFGGRLSNEQVAEVVNYVRSNFGNRFDDRVSANDVQPLRK